MIKTLKCALLFVLSVSALLLADDAAAHKVFGSDCTRPAKGGEFAPDGALPVYHTEECQYLIPNTTRALISPHIHTYDAFAVTKCQQAEAAADPSATGFELSIRCANIYRTVYTTPVSPPRFRFPREVGGPLNEVTCSAPDDFANPLADTVSCFKQIFTTASLFFYTKVVQQFSTLIKAFATLAIIITGFRVIFGTIPVRVELALLILKLAIVFAVANDPIFIYQWSQYAIDFGPEAGEVIMDKVLGVGNDSILELSSDAATADDFENEYLINATDGITFFTSFGQDGKVNCQGTDVFTESVWGRFDCILVNTFGFDLDGGATNFKIMNFGAITIGSLWMGGFGALIMTISLLALVMLFGTMVQSAFIYIKCIVAIMFLGALTPIILPLWFFGMFRRMVSTWLLYILTFAFMPVFLFAFLAMTLIVLTMVTAELSAVYQQVEIASSGNSGKLTTTVFATDSIQFGPDQIQSFSQELRKLQSYDLSDTPIVSEDSYISYVDSSNPAGLEAVANMNPSDVTELLDMKISMNILDIPLPLRMSFIGLMLGYILILWIMLSYLAALPKNVASMVAKVYVASPSNVNLGQKVLDKTKK